jgi:hypothetical protein
MEWQKNKQIMVLCCKAMYVISFLNFMLFQRYAVRPHQRLTTRLRAQEKYLVRMHHRNVCTFCIPILIYNTNMLLCRLSKQNATLVFLLYVGSE